MSKPFLLLENGVRHTYIRMSLVALTNLDVSCYGEQAKVDLFIVHEGVLHTHLGYDGEDVRNIGIVHTKDHRVVAERGERHM